MDAWLKQHGILNTVKNSIQLIRDVLRSAPFVVFGNAEQNCANHIGQVYGFNFNSTSADLHLSGKGCVYFYPQFNCGGQRVADCMGDNDCGGANIIFEGISYRGKCYYQK